MMAFTAGSTEVEVTPLADCAPDIDLLPPPDRDRHHRFVDRDAADAYLRRRSELRRRLGARLGRDPAGLRFDTEANDKPVLADEPGERGRPLHFNLSRSGPLMALAIDRDRPVGVDIECHAIHRGLTAASLTPALHPEELDALAGDRLDDILQCWVLKEAWIKWTGAGIQAPLREMNLWRPGLPGRFDHDGAEVHLRRLGPDDGLEPAWVGVVKAAAAG